MGLLIDNKKNKHIKVSYSLFGVVYDSIEDACKAHGLEYKTVLDKAKRLGFSIEPKIDMNTLACVIAYINYSNQLKNK
ncbi:MAG: hypothetical protein J6A59_10545 [Lachnospiraceae bacterium]|nr:hypothetical protein [Lachnospiraceae bacterium]